MPSYDVERAAMHRLFQHRLLANKNSGGQFWDGTYLDPERLQKSMGRWSSGERALAALAINLWGYTEVSPAAAKDLNPCYWCGNLDGDALIAALEAMATRAGLLPPGDRLAVMPSPAPTLV